jgi:dolichyl-phosphate mannosyltransferase polypeptide 2 regulatory subunit
VNWLRNIEPIIAKHPSKQRKQTTPTNHTDFPTWAPATRYVPDTSPTNPNPNPKPLTPNHQLDRFVGLAMLILASSVFAYYTVWTLLMVCYIPNPPNPPTFSKHILTRCFPQPFVDDSHAIQSLFPPRVWAIRIPVILLLLGGAVVGSFLSVVMVRSNRKKAAKAAKAQQGQKAQ